MRQFIQLAAVLVFVTACSSTREVLVDVPPRLDLKSYGTLGVIEFSSNYDAATNTRATREFVTRIHTAQPGTRVLELGSREALLAGVGAKQLDPDALRRIGAKAGADALLIGDIAYSDPKTDIRINDLSRLDGGMRTEVRGDLSVRMVETKSGASVWSGSSWARRQVNRVNVSASQGISGSTSDTDPRSEMVPDLVRYATQDFRSTTVRQQVPK
jgi:hypothetical protein